MDDDPVVAGENASDLALVPLCQEFDPHSGVITDILFGSGSAGLGNRGRIAEAMPHFERAVALNPGDENARRNLDAARRALSQQR